MSAPRRFRVALVTMPFAACDRPSLGLGLLAAGLERVGIACEVKYFNLTFWRMLGHRAYHALAQQMPNTALTGEWLFSQVFWGERASSWARYEAEILDDRNWGVDVEQRGFVRDALALAPSFVRVAYESNDWSRFDLVGFTSTFEQTLASLCLARMIRASHPEVRLAFGGANFEASMGAPYLEQFELIDYVSIGEADHSFPLLCQRLADARSRGEPDAAIELPPGILGRADVCAPERGSGRLPVLAQELAAARAPEPVRALDELPIPDFHAYFDAVAAYADPRSRAGHPAKPWLALETSRGCWWGQKNHCTFCGLNGETMGFRRKQAARVEAEIAELEARHGRRPIQFSDNILSHDYFADLIPAWADDPEPTRKFFEIKANLRREQVEALARAGIVQVQPGIESLDDAVLVEMRKGVSAAQNLALLRWTTESGVRAYWNILVGFPREPRDSYARQLELLPKISHLPPPTGCSLIRLDRFSPNFDAWREHGFSHVEPLPAYRHLYPFDDATIARLAYFFRYDHPNMRAAIAGTKALAGFARRWRRAHAAGEAGRLAVEISEGEAVLVDERPLLDAEPRSPRRLADVELALLLACDRPCKPTRALERARALAPGEARQALARLVEDAILIELGGALINVALLPPSGALAELTVARAGDVSSWLRRAR